MLRILLKNVAIICQCLFDLHDCSFKILKIIDLSIFCDLLFIISLLVKKCLLGKERITRTEKCETFVCHNELTVG